jgi:GNAT superfamily N-acetyltransferase
MYTSLGSARIKSGEVMEIGVIQAPDPLWTDRLSAFLNHKGPDWVPQVEAALNGPLDTLKSLFFIGQIDGRLACHTVVSGDRRVGILGHVYTRPEDRRKGAIKVLLEHLLAYCVDRFDVLTLMTEFDSPAYRIYHDLGFRGMSQTSDEMLLQSNGKPLPFEAAPTTILPLGWGDWAFLNLIAYQPERGDQLPRSPLLGLKGLGHVEDSFIRFQMRREPGVQANALISEKGATVGWTILAPDQHWFGGVLELDLYVHPNFIDDLPKLAASIDMPSQKVVTYITDLDTPRARALTDIGFTNVARLPEFLESDGVHDLYVMAHS